MCIFLPKNSLKSLAMSTSLTRVYIGRIGYETSERDVEKFFRGYGKIEQVMMKNGFAFVEFKDARDADDACHDLSGKELQGYR